MPFGLKFVSLAFLIPKTEVDLYFICSERETNNLLVIIWNFQLWSITLFQFFFRRFTPCIASQIYTRKYQIRFFRAWSWIFVKVIWQLGSISLWAVSSPFNLLALLHYYLLHAQANKSMSQHAMFLSGLT